MFFGLFGKKKEPEMQPEAMNDAGMNAGMSSDMNSAAPMSPMGTSEEKPMGDAPAPTGAMPDTASEGGE